MTEELKPSYEDQALDEDPTRKSELQTAPLQTTQRPEPTRYGDWEKDGRCIDF